VDLISIILLGIVQGITEWMPISSKTQVTFIYLSFLSGSPSSVLPILLYSHLGTLFAASLYFRKDIHNIVNEISSSPFRYKTYAQGEVGFLFFAVFFTGIVGLPILYLEKTAFSSLNGATIILLMGGGLILTGLLLLSQKRMKPRRSNSVNWIDGIFTGILQGFSTVPGVSRTGTTSTALIWRSFDSESAFRLSFLLSIPTVLMAEVVFYLNSALDNLPVREGIALLISSFLFGYLFLDIILSLVRKINVAYLAIILGVIYIISAFFRVG
jgi:undecaprenyl-diphosphatase